MFCAKIRAWFTSILIILWLKTMCHNIIKKSARTYSYFYINFNTENKTFKKSRPKCITVFNSNVKTLFNKQLVQELTSIISYMQCTKHILINFSQICLPSLRKLNIFYSNVYAVYFNIQLINFLSILIVSECSSMFPGYLYIDNVLCTNTAHRVWCVYPCFPRLMSVVLFIDGVQLDVQ